MAEFDGYVFLVSEYIFLTCTLTLSLRSIVWLFLLKKQIQTEHNRYLSDSTEDNPQAFYSAATPVNMFMFCSCVLGLHLAWL